MIPCKCGKIEAYWHGDVEGFRMYCCDKCYILELEKELKIYINLERIKNQNYGR